MRYGRPADLALLRHSLSQGRLTLRGQRLRVPVQRPPLLVAQGAGRVVLEPGIPDCTHPAG